MCNWYAEFRTVGKFLARNVLSKVPIMPRVFIDYPEEALAICKHVKPHIDIISVEKVHDHINRTVFTNDVINCIDQSGKECNSKDDEYDARFIIPKDELLNH